MTPEEKAVVQAAIEAHGIGHLPSTAQETILRQAVHALIFSCEECNAGGHTCPGDGDSIAHGESNCGKHDEPKHAGADGACPDYGSTLDPCPPGCASGTCVANLRAPEWLPATFADCIVGDRVRLGQEETTVRDTNALLWHARNREWTDDAGKTRDHQTPWEHTVLRMDLEANPGMHEYPAGTACEILCDAERRAALLLQQGFPGSSVVSS